MILISAFREPQYIVLSLSHTRLQPPWASWNQIGVTQVNVIAPSDHAFYFSNIKNLRKETITETLDDHIQQATQPGTLGLDLKLKEAIMFTLKLDSILEIASELVSKLQQAPMHCYPKKT